jgi:hypothetical protein
MLKGQLYHVRETLLQLSPRYSMSMIFNPPMPKLTKRLYRDGLQV